MAKNVKNLPKPHRSEISFDDVVGHKHVKERLKTIIKIIKKPELFERFDTSIPKGLLLYGPVSVGKGMLAKAFAHEAKLPYYEISGSRLFDIDYIKEVYEAASKHSPSLVILEDIDIKGLLQGTFTNVSFSDIAKVLESTDGRVFTIATSQTLESVGETLTAPQKLDFLIEVSKLDKDARRFFITKILKKPHDPKIDIERIVRYITGMSAVELERLGRMAVLNTIEQGKKKITEEILIEQINIIKYGHKVDKQMVRDLEKELQMTAYHEAGHAVLSTLLLPHIKIEQVTIAPRSKTLGFVSYNADEPLSNITKQELFYDLCVLLAGRIVKMKKAGSDKMDSGAIDDLSQASFQIYAAITTLGMDNELGLINIETITPVTDTFLKEKIEERFLHWLKTAQRYSKKLVNAHWETIERLAKKLIEKEIVEGDELLKLVGKKKATFKLPKSL
ncbi:AAA family ATPase [Sulfurovum sp. ST-21]|uniref:AAA family ATPase n=1 Tax=Sulfurovum indicum TaxID=2779528 RepID=A0A7M1S272_9BACT|nr:AAA family ATPase [Sulfurovum indicum]QOR61426.1 AAA family ATPase [Sulfurovum indicum]